MRLGSIIVLKSSSRGASKTRVSSNSTSDRRFIFSSLSVAITVFLLLVLDLVQKLVQAPEALLPERAVALDPLVRHPERSRVQTGRPPLGLATALDELRALEHLQMLRDRRQAHVERLRELGHGGLASGEDRPPRGIGKGRERQAQG